MVGKLRLAYHFFKSFKMKGLVMSSGKLVYVEGYKGSGKTSLTVAIKEKLEAEGYEVEWLREPGGTVVSEQLRNIINGTLGLDEFTRLMLFLAARRELHKEKVLPLIKKGVIVITDRSILSSYSNQLTDKLFDATDKESLRDICKLAQFNVEPDLLLYLDTSLDTCIKVREVEDGKDKHYSVRGRDTHEIIYNRLEEEVDLMQGEGVETIKLPYDLGIEGKSLVCLSAIKNLIKD